MYISFTLTVLIGLLISTELKAEHDVPDDENVMATIVGPLSTHLYYAMNSGEDNMIISPLSLSYLLSALSMGAENETLVELKKVLSTNFEKPIIKSTFKPFTEMLKDDKNLTISTNLFVDMKFKLNNDFVDDISNSFNIDFKNVDFENNPLKTMTNINTIVDSKTNHLVQGLLTEGKITNDTTSILVNTVYFKSNWLYPFEKKMTKQKTFYGIDKNYTTELMYLHDTDLKYKYDSELNSELLELPYVDGYSFLIIIPKDVAGITEVEKVLQSKINEDKISSFLDVFKGTRTTGVVLYLPKFQFNEVMELKPTLTQLGLNTLFSNEANLKDISSDSLFIDQVIQSIYINVDESTETAHTSGFTELKLKTKLIHVNRPFIFIIKHELTRTPLFIGKYMKPK